MIKKLWRKIVMVLLIIFSPIIGIIVWLCDSLGIQIPLIDPTNKLYNTKIGKKKKKKTQVPDEEMRYLDEVIRRLNVESKNEHEDFLMEGDTSEKKSFHRYILLKVSKDNVVVNLNPVVESITPYKISEIPDDKCTEIIRDENVIGLRSKVEVMNMKFWATSAHVAAIMDYRLDEMVMTNPHIYASRRCGTIMVRYGAVKRHDKCWIWTRRLDNWSPVIISTMIYEVIRYPINQNQRTNLYPIAIIIEFNEAEKYILSGSVVLANEIPYIISSAHPVSDDEETTLVVAHIVQPHNTTIKVRVLSV